MNITEEYDEQLYLQNQPDRSDSDAIDSDVEERILSHVYYQQQSPAADTTDSKYKSIKQPPLQATLVRPYRSATNSSDSEQDEESNQLSYNTSNHTTLDTYLDQATTSATIQLDSAPIPEDNTDNRRTAEEEFGYLDEAEIQGHSRYFMEEKEILCRRCNRSGHVAKDCDTINCTICGQDGHTSRNCQMTGSVCHSCNMRGHLAIDCPLKQKQQKYKHKRAHGCDRCSARNHHTEECSSIWRKYCYTREAKEVGRVVPWCYNCAAKGHFGDDCTLPAAKGASAFLGNTAFSKSNCPAKFTEKLPANGHTRFGPPPSSPEKNRRSQHQQQRSSGPRERWRQNIKHSSNERRSRSTNNDRVIKIHGMASVGKKRSTSRRR